MTTYAGAIPVTSVVCPPWCTTTQQEHLDELHHNDGICFHWRDRRGPGWLVGQQTSTFVDGSPDVEDGPRIYPDAHAQTLPLDEAESFARAILAAIEEVRA